MGLIVIGHIPVPIDVSNSWGAILSQDFLLCFNKLTGAIGNSLFFLISGYFAMIHGINLKRTFKICIPIWFYNLFFFSLNLFTRVEPLNFNVKNYYLWYFLTGNSQFVIGFTFVQFLASFMIKYFSSKDLKKQILIVFYTAAIFVLFAIPSRFFPIFFNSIFIMPFIGYGLGYFWIFLIGGIIAQKKPHVSHLSLFISSFILIGVNSYFTLSTQINEFPFSAITWNLLCPLLAINIFVFTSQLRIMRSSFINNFAKLMFGVYLVHTNPLSPLSPLLYGDTPIVLEHGPPQPYYSLWTLLAAFAIFIICSFVEFLRLLSFRKAKTLIRPKPT